MNRIMAFVIALACFHGVAALAAEPDSKTAAKEHYQRGVAAFKENRFGEAASEFRSAYDLSPAYAVLYNIGQVNVALGDAVSAVDAFEKYLAQGGTAITKERRQAVEAEIEKQRDRIGTLLLRVQPEGAEIRVDGKLVGKAPLSEPLHLTEGKREIVVFASGYDARVRELEVAPKSQMDIEISLDKVGSEVQSSPQVASPPQIQAPTSVTSSEASTPPVMLATSAANQPESEPASGKIQRTAGYVIGAVGIGVTSTGLVLALTSASRASTAQNQMSAAHDTGDIPAYDAAKSNYDSAKSNNKLGWACLGLGAAALVGGFVLVATAPTAKAGTAWAVTPWNTAHAGGMMAQGNF